MQTTPVWEKCVTCRESKLKALNKAELLGEAAQGGYKYSVWPHVKLGLGTLNTFKAWESLSCGEM